MFTEQLCIMLLSHYSESNGFHWFCQYLPCSWHCAGCLMCLLRHLNFIATLWDAAIIVPILQMGKCSLERWCHLPRTIQHSDVLFQHSSVAEPKACAHSTAMLSALPDCTCSASAQPQPRPEEELKQCYLTGTYCLLPRGLSQSPFP